MPTQYPLTPGELASDCYPADAQTLYNEMFSKGFVSLDIVGVVRQVAEPAATERNKLWVKLDAGTGDPVGRFIFANGSWRWPHEIPPNDKRLFLFEGSAAEVVTLDDGTAATISDTTGAFWEVAAEWPGRVPIGAGAIPGADPAVTLAVGDDAGAAGQTIANDQLPEHRHFIANTDVIASGGVAPTDSSYVVRGADYQGSAGTTEDDYRLAGSATEPTIGLTSATGEATPTAVSIIQPVRAVYFIRRSARKFRSP